MGDDDLKGNGEILDPGGPAAAPLAAGQAGSGGGGVASSHVSSRRQDSLQILRSRAAKVYTNRPPLAVNDNVNAQTSAPNPKVIPVLANDSDPDGDALTIIAVGGIAPGGKGSTVAIGAGVILYNQGGGVLIGDVETFTYTISDDKSGTATATVSATAIL